MRIIENREELLSHGNRYGRRIAVDIIEYAFRAIDSYEAVKKIVRIDDQRLIVGRLKYDLSQIGNIYVVGAGKGATRIGKALEDILADRIKKGMIIEKRGQGEKLGRIEVLGAGHPIPDEQGMKGAKGIIEIAKGVRGGDLVFACITGGCSALLPLPAEGISLEDKKRITDLLLKCGATIDEINAVRKHISAIKGGRLAMLFHPAEIINLIVVDEPAGVPWGPTVPDATTFSDAVFVLKKHNLLEEIPFSIRRHLAKADPRQETPKVEDFRRVGVKAHNFVLATGETICEAAKKKAEELGFNSTILSTVMEGESREVGVALAGVVKEIEKKGRPLKPPCVLVVGGETTVTIVGQPGEGGRNQEFALAASQEIGGSKRIVIASVGTDGTDGLTDIAGGIVDGCTQKRADEKGIDLSENLSRHNSSYVFRELGDAIFTASNGTNVMDLRLLVVTTFRQKGDIGNVCVRHRSD